MDIAEKMYIDLLEYTAKNYYQKTYFTISDRVGYVCTQIEELLRPLWGIGPVIKERNLLFDFNGKKIKAEDFITQIMLEGTDAKSTKRFDINSASNPIGFANQAVTEIAAYLVTVYFAKEKLWDSLSNNDKKQISDWILKWSIIAIKNSWPNNHYWYPLICIEILKQLGTDCSEADEYIENGYKELDSLYVDKGWYSDGTFGRFDFYHAWAHHTYTLLWILIADKESKNYHYRAEVYKKRTEEYIKFYTHYFDSDGGIAAYGRSLSYRFAAISIFSLAALCNCDVDYSLLKTLIIKNIKYYFKNSIITADGVFKVGYLYDAPRIGEFYSTVGASTCYTQGLMCLYADENHKLWNSPDSKLPVEKEDFLIYAPVEGVEIALQGNNEFSGVTMYNNSIHYYQDDFFTSSFNDMAGAYSKFAYNSRFGFSLSTRDLVSSDNMISLITSDGQMYSHRKRIIPLGIKDDVMISKHYPYSNDMNTFIKTYMCPLNNGYHIRIHFINLSQPYIIKEGGFTIGLTDDGFTEGNGIVKYRNYISAILNISNFKTALKAEKNHPGMHILKPQSIYPFYISDVLDEGTYISVAIVGISSSGRLASPPDVSVDENKVSVFYEGNRKEILISSGSDKDE